MENEQEKKKVGRPKNNPIVQEVVDEKNQDRLDMEKRSQEEYITIDDLGKRWSATFQKIAALDQTTGIGTVATQWNKLNPFLQNQRIKNLYSTARTYNKANISEFLANPANFEKELRSLSWANSSSQQIYYNILRRASDIPLYNYYLIPELLDIEEYNDKDFQSEDRLIHEWVETFNIPNTFKTMALEIKREGKSSYLLRNKFIGEGKNKHVGFTTLQKLPSDWVKITGKSQLGFTISFDMMYFLNIANSPADFGDFMVKAWADMVNKGIVTNTDNQGKWEFNSGKAANYSFNYGNNNYASTIEIMKKGRKMNYMFWLKLPFDICYTFGSDNSQPWVAPDTMGLMLKLQELTDYGQLAGLIASTPLTAVLTGEIETIDNPRAGKNESVYSPEVLQGYMTQFNQATSTNVEAWLWPAKNIKLQQLSSDVNSSEIISSATENFVSTAGEGGLTITTEKPNVAQVTVTKQLAAAQQNYVTLQFENVLNYIIKHKLGFSYAWKIKIWGDVFNHESDRKFLKEVVANGNIALLPKLMSAEGISIRDTKAMTEYIKTFDFYKDFMTYTQTTQIAQKEEDEAQGAVGRPGLDDEEIDNDATAASKEAGTNTSDNRDQE